MDLTNLKVSFCDDKGRHVAIELQLNNFETKEYHLYAHVNSLNIHDGTELLYHSYKNNPDSLGAIFNYSYLFGLINSLGEDYELLTKQIKNKENGGL